MHAPMPRKATREDEHYPTLPLDRIAHAEIYPPHEYGGIPRARIHLHRFIPADALSLICLQVEPPCYCHSTRDRE